MNKEKPLNNLRIILILVLAVSLTGVTIWKLSRAIPAPTTNPVCEPGNCSGGSYDVRIYKDSSTAYCAGNGHLGGNFGCSTTADISSLWSSIVIPNCPTSGCYIYIESGTYTSLSQMNPSSNYRIVSGRGVTIQAGASMTNMLLFNNKDNMIVDGGVWDCNSLVTHAGIEISGHGNGIVTGAEAKNCLQYGIEADFTKNVTISYTVTHGNTKNGILVTGGGAGQDTEAVLTGNRAYSNGDGTITAAGIYLSNAWNSTVSNNIMLNNNPRGMLVGASHWSTISSNVIEKTQGGFPTSVALYLDFNNEITVVGNVVNGNTGYGIDNTSGFGGLIIGNTAEYNYVGIYNDQNNATITGNQVKYNVLPMSFAGAPVGVVLRDNNGMNPIGNVNFPFCRNTAPACTSGPPIIKDYGSGTGQDVPVANMIYSVSGADIILTSSLGTGVSISVACAGTPSYISGAATLTREHIWTGCTINFGNFSVAPLVTVVAN